MALVGSGVRGILEWLMIVLIINKPLHSHSLTTVPTEGRLCVEEGVDCSSLTQVSDGLLSCTPTRDRLDCLKKIRDGEADFGYFEAEDINIAALAFEDQYEAVLQAAQGDEIQRVYLLVHNASNPQPSTLCHPGIDHNRYYPTALYRPVLTSTPHSSLNIKSVIEQVSADWTAACIPGRWSQDPQTDHQLKQQYSQLCETCLRHTCASDDPYTGSGALQCLLDRAADAAVVSDVDLKAIRAKNPNVEELYHYCGDGRGRGTIHPLADKTSGEEEPCDWGKRPLPNILFAPCSNSEDCHTLRSLWVRGLTTHASTVLQLLGLPAGTRITKLDPPQPPSQIIKKAGYKARRTPNKRPVKFCVRSQEELEKCQDLMAAAQGYGADAGVGLGCHLYRTNASCYSSLYFERADVISLDGGDVYQVTKDFGFERVLSEVYESQSATPTSSYYAVAVVRANSNITTFTDLQGRKSCHTGIGKTAGWKLPVATLLELRLIDPQHCNYVSAMAEFFSGGSCAPGAKIPRYNKQDNYVTRLCSLCVGAEDDQCARSSQEPFYSYTGAFRCLVHGGGDVAFVKHTTVPDNTDGSNSDDWAVDLRSGDYKLLCPSNSGTRTAAVTDYATCNLALVPAHEVVVSGILGETRKKQVRQVLLEVAQVFKPGAPGSKSFKLFGRYKGRADLLFKDSARGLKDLSEDTLDERQRKQAYYDKLNELHSCEVRVCALEDQLNQCEAMVETMNEMGQRFVCVSARDRLDCVRRVVKGQVDMTPLPANYLKVNPDLRIIAYAKNPANSQDAFRYLAVVVVRRETVGSLRDLRGKKSCHTGYGRTTGWQIPLAMLKQKGVIQPICEPNQSFLQHEMASLATTFNRACVPGEWATVNDTDAALKQRFAAMCSLCNGRTCDKGNTYAGYEGALKCLTQNGGDVAFSKLSKTLEFFKDNRAVNTSEYGLLCPNGQVVDISETATDCFWAARPWDTFVTHGGANEAKIQKIMWALTQAKWKGEEDLASRQWYFNTLGIDEEFSDLLPDMENKTTGEYYAESKMDVVREERMCTDEREKPVRFCVTSDLEFKKCSDLSTMLKLRGVWPELSCTRGNDVNQCVTSIVAEQSDVIALNDTQRFRTIMQNNFSDLLSESYPASESNRYYLVGVIKNNSTITRVQDLKGKSTCNVDLATNINDTIYSNLANCLGVSSNFFRSYREAFICLMGSNKDIAFVKHDINTDGGLENLKTRFLDPTNFQLVCEYRTLPVSSYNVRECNLGRVPADMIVTRQAESYARKEDMRHVLLKASRYFGRPDSFFRLFYDYFSTPDLLFRDDTVELSPVTEDHHSTFMTGMMDKACDLYIHHLRSTI